MKQKKEITFLGVTLGVLMMIAASLLALSYLSVFINPTKFWFMSVFGLLYIPLVLLNVFLLVIALIHKSVKALIALFILFPSVFLFGLYYRCPDKSANADKTEEVKGNVKLISYNVGRFSLSSKELKMGSMKNCFDSVMRFLVSKKADIICLQEFASCSADKIRNSFEKYFPGYDIEYYVYTNAKGCYGNVILSRFPLKRKNKLSFERSSNLAISCDYDIYGTILRIYNCHFQSYNISLARIAKSFRNKEILMDTEERMKKAIVLRPKQVDMVVKDIENSPVESIVTGDFNDTPISYTYNRLSYNRKDAFVEAGSGFGGTYSFFLPILRIDYILFPKRYNATSWKIDKVKYSDHFPITAELDIN